MKRIIALLGVGALVWAGCSKELSYEGPDIPAEGSMQSALTGDCLPKTVTGTYKVAVPLVADSNTISVNVNVLSTGTYLITTDTVNGFFFNATGRFTTPGSNTVKLRSVGTPFASGVNNFRISFDSTFCDVQINVQ
jgi:hypothetical protein